MTALFTSWYGIAMISLLFSVVVITSLSLPGHSSDSWTKRLSADSPEAARAELIALGKDATPLLLDVLEDGTSKAAFQAAIVFTELGNKGKSAVPELLEGLDDGGLKAKRRSYYALALSGSEGSARKIVPALFEYLDGTSDAEVTRAVQVSLAALGKNAAAPTMKALTKENDVVRMFRLSEVMVAQAGHGAKAAKTLGKWTADVKTGYKGLVSINCLKAFGKKGAKPLEQALRKRSVMGAAALPFGPETTWSKIIMFLRGQVQVNQVPATGLSVPSTFEDLVDDSYITLAEILVSLSGHLGQETGRLSAEWLSGSITTEKAWRAEIKGVERSDALIRALLEQ